MSVQATTIIFLKIKIMAGVTCYIYAQSKLRGNIK